MMRWDLTHPSLSPTMGYGAAGLLLLQFGGVGGFQQVQFSRPVSSSLSRQCPAVSSFSRLGGVGVEEEEEASQPSAGPPPTTCCLPPVLSSTVLLLCLPAWLRDSPSWLCSCCAELSCEQDSTVLCRVIPTRTRQSTPLKKKFLTSTGVDSSSLDELTH